MKHLLMLLVAMSTSSSLAAELPFRRLAHGSEYHDFPTSLYFITNDYQWQQIWSERHKGSEPMPALPKVDFGSSVIIGFYAGVRGSSGFDVRITKIIETELKITVVVEEKTPGDDCTVLTMVGSPYEFVVIKGRSERKSMDVNLVVKPISCSQPRPNKPLEPTR